MAKSGFRPAAPLALLTALLAGVAGAATFDVSNNADDGPGSLRQAILDANASADDDTITFSFDPGDGAILLDSALPVIEGSVTLNGAGVAGLTIDGADSHRVFFVLEGAVEIQELTVRNGFAQGGAGSGRGGGGLGAGGALFVGENASVTLSGVAFEDNRAQGGDGGDASTNGGGGGGLGGDGGSGSGGGGGGTLGSGGSSNGGAGGGGGSEGDGGNGTPTVAGSGGTGGDPDGGAGGAFNVSGSPGGAGGGGGGGGPFSGLNSPSGGAGGRFGGGGGGTGGGLGGAGGEYGGGGGAGGDGGFGGGGGGGSGGIAPGSGGFGAGDGGSTTGGGGGSAFGGGIFVQAGGQLEIVNSSLSNDEVDTLLPGMGGGGGMDGEAEGGSLYIPVDAQVTFTTDTGNRLIFGSIGGEGGIVKSVRDRLDLFGANTYSGGTVVQQGTLRGDGTSLQGEIEIQQAATLYAFHSADSTLTGSISGAGLLRKGGSGQLTLEGTNSYTGGTLLEGGRIRGDTDSLTGDFVMLGGTRLIFRQVGSTGTHAGDISGLGRVIKRGDGTVILTGTNSYSGETVVGAGVLQGDTDSLQGMITTNASLVFDQAFDGTFADPIVGTGSVRKQGAGQLLVTGSWAHDDVTTVAAGRLDLTGLIQNDVDVLSGAVFGGSGNVGGELQPFAGGSVSPGLAGLLGTLDAASVRFDAGSVFSVDIDPDTLTSDRLDVAGTATLDMAATVSVNRLPGDLGGAEVYTIVDAANVVGGFAPATLEDLAFFDGSVATVASDVILTLAPNGSTFEDWATTPNQTAVARVLDVELPLPTGNADLDDVFGNLFGLTEQGVATALDDISGEGITAFTTVRLANGRQFARTATARLGVVGGRMVGGTGTADLVASLPGGARPGGALAALDGLGAGGATASSWLMAAAGPSVSMGIEKRQRFAFWLDPYGLLGGVDGDGNSADTQWWAAGVSGGFDGRIGDHGLLGVAAAWAHLDVDADARRFSGDANVFQGGVYGAWVGERLYASGLARYAYSDLAHKRTIAFGEINHRPEGDSAGHEAGVHAELGWVAFSPVGLQIEPMAGLDYTWLSRDGFSESGSGAGSSLNLDVGSESWNSLLTTVGLRVHRRFVFGDTERLTFMPEIWARWAHEFGDRDRPLDAALSGAVNGGPFRVTGARMARDGALLGIGWSVNRSNDLSFLTYYDLGWNPDALSHALAIGVIFRW